MNTNNPIDVIKIGLTLLFLIVACIEDIQTRKVSNKTILFAIPIALLNLIPFITAQEGSRLTQTSVLYTVILLAVLFILWVLRVLGGADIKVLMVLAIIFPAVPILYDGGIITGLVSEHYNLNYIQPNVSSIDLTNITNLSGTIFYKQHAVPQLTTYSYLPLVNPILGLLALQVLIIAYVFGTFTGFANLIVNIQKYEFENISANYALGLKCKISDLRKTKFIMLLEDYNKETFIKETYLNGKELDEETMTKLETYSQLQRIPDTIWVSRMVPFTPLILVGFILTLIFGNLFAFFW